MSHFKEVFSKSPVILPVIHVESMEQTLRNAEIAREAGCDGVFLINHSINYNNLLKIHQTLSSVFRDWWIGVNCLDLHPQEIFCRIEKDVDGIWVDNAMIDERCQDQPAADMIKEKQLQTGWRGLYFGGVAFKYQRHVESLAQAARLATKYMDVVTTSGPGTGQAALLEKIFVMKKALEDFPLAIASGITPDNVHNYDNVADCFLVATGISKNFTELDPALVKALIKEAGRA